MLADRAPLAGRRRNKGVGPYPNDLRATRPADRRQVRDHPDREPVPLLRGQILRLPFRSLPGRDGQQGGRSHHRAPCGELDHGGGPLD